MNNSTHLLDIAQKNIGKASIFSEINGIDYYDGYTIALCKLSDFEEWYICFLSSLNIETGERIFALLNITSEQASLIKVSLDNYDLSLDQRKESMFEKIMTQVESLTIGFTGSAFLMKARYLESINYAVKRIPISEIYFFSDITTVYLYSNDLYKKQEQFFK